MRKAVILLLITLFPLAAVGVDGYKNLKFGMSVKEIKKKKPCTMKFMESQSDKSMKTYYCDDFKLAGKNRGTVFMFIDNKFVRFVASMDVNHTRAILESLSKKYGRPRMPSDEVMTAVDKFPNRTADAIFDKGTIIARIFSDANMEQSFLLIYTQANFDALMLQKASESLADDL